MTTVDTDLPYDDDQDEDALELQALALHRRRRLPLLTAALAVGVVAAGAFIGGVEVQKHSGGSSGGSAGGSSAFARFRGTTTGTTGTSTTRGGFGAGGFGAGGGVTAGTVSVIKGSTLYVADFLGNTIKVVIPPGARVTESKQLTVRGIHPGDTVTAQVTKLANGNYRATTVTVSPSSGGT